LIIRVLNDMNYYHLLWSLSRVFGFSELEPYRDERIVYDARTKSDIQSNKKSSAEND